MHHDDFKFEPVHGLPEALPEGEHILWQGRPNSLRLAKDAWKLNWVLGYFVVLCIWRVGISSTAVPLIEAMGHGVPFLIAGALAGTILYVLAIVQARSTVYTLTNKRVAMRIGAALTMTLNLPYVQIRNAELMVRKSGMGTIAFDLMGDTRLSYLMTWPHTRPWRFAKTQPAFRAIPDAARVAAIFAEAAETRVSEPQVTRISPQSDAIAAE
ncbi:PH domain-containing protein [Sulfitobacter sp. JBTF-M27]|uniref:PH domain-containing protein n=1 Tax=Sulfitobacter sediminilitoris TaxID=2698830 RepID=A0A6P0CFK0_9RHOB|nr:photosynthetic complex putative assembly protein PuhB [Sulfitobacter sediminilitoris]NEK24160.1 PH domain-containing protein [Sulfitobacter sediminilitoris]